jgi:hypothetical protein
MPTEHVPIEVKILRDVAMLRKLNNDLISSSWMDDFLVDCYMKMYKLVREDGRRPETAISIPSTSREGSVSGDGEDVRIRPARASRREILQKVAALCRPPPVPAKVVQIVLTGANLQGRGKHVVEESMGQDDEISMKSASPQPSRPLSPEVMEIDATNGTPISGNLAEILI